MRLAIIRAQLTTSFEVSAMTDYTRPESAEDSFDFDDSEDDSAVQTPFTPEDWVPVKQAKEGLGTTGTLPEFLNYGGLFGKEGAKLEQAPAPREAKGPKTYDQLSREEQNSIDQSIKDLTSDDRDVRAKARKSLDEQGHAAAQRLAAGLNSKSAAEREAALGMLVRMGDKAVPALYEALDKPLSPEQEKLAKFALGMVIQESESTTFRDAKGNIRRVVDGESRKTLMEATYTEKGELDKGTIRGTTFNRQKDGSYTRSDCKGNFPGAHVTSDGGIRFGFDDSKETVEWAPDGRTLFYSESGKLYGILTWGGKWIDQQYKGLPGDQDPLMIPWRK